MAFWSRLRKSTPSAEQRVSLDDPNHWIIKLTDSLARAGSDTSIDGAMKQSVVYSCIRVISETIASLPMVLYKRGEGEAKEPARDHYLFPLLHDSPNNFQTAFEFREMASAHLCLRGNHFSFLERDQGGRIRRIVPVHPDRITVKMKDANRQILEYEYKDPETGKPSTYSVDEIWHMKGLSSDGFIGLSPIELHRRSILLARVAEDHGISYFQNGARASGIAKLPGMLKEGAKKDLKESIQAGMTGDNKFKVLVFEQGMEWQQVSLTNEDSQYLETRAFQVQDIARIFRVPTILIGHPDKASTYASAEQFMLSFVTHTIRPWVVRIEQSANRALLTEEERAQYFFKFKIEGLLRGDTKTRYEGYASAIQARWMNANEVRALEDMNPREGGDEFENPSIDLTKQGDKPNDNTGNQPPTEPDPDEGD